MQLVDMANWERREHFDVFQNMDFPHYSMSVKLDATQFLAAVRQKKLSFYFSMIYKIMETSNLLPSFRYRIRGRQVVLHERVYPSFTYLENGSETFKQVVTDLKDDIAEFGRYARAMAESQKSYFILKEHQGRDDLMNISCIPWISFEHFSRPVGRSQQDSVPKITIGKYFEENGRIRLPFSILVNHTLIDGVHLGRFINELQSLLDSPLD